MKIFAEVFNDLCDAIELTNSTFTFHIIFVITSFLLTNVFAVYITLREVLSEKSEMMHIAIAACVFVVVQYSIKVFIAHIGSSTSIEAGKPMKIVSKALATMDYDENMKTDLNFLLIQMQSRNKILQNVFFAINWNFIMAVS